jgi:hypothetical protein
LNPKLSEGFKRGKDNKLAHKLMATLITPKQNRREIIEGLVKFYIDNKPSEYADAVKHAKEVRKTKANIFGSDIDKDFRHELSLPAKLYELITKSIDNPEFLKENDEAAWFRKRFPEFAGSEKW